MKYRFSDLGEEDFTSRHFWEIEILEFHFFFFYVVSVFKKTKLSLSLVFCLFGFFLIFWLLLLGKYLGKSKI